VVGVTADGTAPDDAGAPVPDTYAAYAEREADPRFTDWLRARAEPDWTAATTHRFTRELATGEIKDAVFRRYLVSDYAFIETLVGAFGRAVGDAPTMAAKSRLVDFLGVLTDDENDYFERSFDALGVDEATRTEPELTPTVRAFADLLERASREGGYAETLAVLVPAEWVYLTWAQAAAEGESPSQFYLAEWIDLHANDAFADFVGWLRTELDREGAAAAPQRQQRLARHFRRTVALEVAFFESVYQL
jgi:thiaminase/transcriptional activator TenA